MGAAHTLVALAVPDSTGRSYLVQSPGPAYLHRISRVVLHRLRDDLAREIERLDLLDCRLKELRGKLVLTSGELSLHAEHRLFELESMHDQFADSPVDAIGTMAPLDGA